MLIASASRGSAARLQSLLAGKADQQLHVSPAKLKTALLDTHSPTALTLRDIILAMRAPAAGDAGAEAVLKAQELVRDFDGHLAADSAAAVLLEAFRVALTASIAKPLGVVGSVVAGADLTPFTRIGTNSLK